MTTTADPVTGPVTAARAEWPRVMAVLLRETRDLGIAGHCVDVAYASAAHRWGEEGAPEDPTTWLIEAARACAVAGPAPAAEDSLPMAWPPGGDDALDETRLVFLACHPDVSPYMRAALTLRLVCGVPVRDIATLFGVAEPAMASTLRRSKAKIAASRRSLPPSDGGDFGKQLGEVLTVASGLIAAAHRPPVAPERLGVDLMVESIALIDRLHRLFPHDTETSATLAQAQLVRAWGRAPGLGTGESVPLLQQDRGGWSREAIDAAHELVMQSLHAGGRGPQVLRAAILSLLSRPMDWSEVDWNEILQLHEVLVCVDRSPGAALSRLIAVAQVDGPQTALTELTHLERIEHVPPSRQLYSTKAELLEAVGRGIEAATWRRQAQRYAATPYDWDLLAQRILPTP